MHVCWWLTSLTLTKRRRVTKLVENPEQNRNQSSIIIGTNIEHKLIWHWEFEHSIIGTLKTIICAVSISNSAILRNNNISLLSVLCACIHVKKMVVAKEAIVPQWAVQTALSHFKPAKKPDGLVHCSLENAAVLCENHCGRVTQIWTSLSEEEGEEEEGKKNILAIMRLSGLVLLRCFLAPLGVLFIMKTLEEGRLL